MRWQNEEFAAAVLKYGEAAVLFESEADPASKKDLIACYTNAAL
jgi:hypothetical protein